MKKILFVINTLGGAGAENALISLLNCMDKNRFEISLFVLTGQGELVTKLPENVKLLNKNYDDSSVLSEEGKKALKKHLLKQMFQHGAIFKNIPYLLKNFFQMVKNKSFFMDKLLWKVVSDGADQFDTTYDLAVSYIEGGSSYYVSDHIKAKKKVAFVHTNYKRAGFTRNLDHQIYDRFDRIYCVSDEAETIFTDFYPEYLDKTSVFYNIVDENRIHEMAKEPGFTDDFSGIRILSVGRITIHKAYEYSVEAMKRIKDQGIHARWYVLGEGEERNKIEKLIEKLGLKEDFILLGAVSNPYPYFKETDIYVHASLYEGRSIAIQEAKISGCPIVASDCSGNREQIQHEKNGLIVNLDSKEISDAVLRLIRDESLRLRFSEAVKKENTDSKKKVEELYTLT